MVLKILDFVGGSRIFRHRAAIVTIISRGGSTPTLRFYATATIEKVNASASLARTVSASAPVVGRYAPSPSGDLHLGNLRTAAFAWLMAQRLGGSFHLRIEDLDRVREGSAQQQITDLSALGISWDSEILYQSQRTEAYRKAVDSLTDRGLTYECFCTRREIQAATSAPHAAPGAYPGTCRNLTEQQKQARRASRRGAIRLRAQVNSYTVVDDFVTSYTGDVDDFVLVRNDGTYAYNLASVVDDHFQGVTQVTRGDDLLSSAPRQAYLANLLGFAAPRYAHVPLVLNAEGKRLSKRDGAVTLRRLRAAGLSTAAVMRMVSASIPLAPVHDAIGGSHLPENVVEMLEVFSPDTMYRGPWVMGDPLAEILKIASTPAEVSPE